MSGWVSRTSTAAESDGRGDCGLARAIRLLSFIGAAIWVIRVPESASLSNLVSGRVGEGDGGGPAGERVQESPAAPSSGLRAAPRACDSGGERCTA
jgi:hypothetical protein